MRKLIKEILDMKNEATGFSVRDYFKLLGCGCVMTVLAVIAGLIFFAVLLWFADWLNAPP